MSLQLFVESLVGSGRARVAMPREMRPEEDGYTVGSGDSAEIDESDGVDLAKVLANLDAVARLELAHEPPAISLKAAVWAARRLHQAAQALVYREIQAEWVNHVLSIPCPEEPGPQSCYSADLLLRYLPDLTRLARGVASDDPLTLRLAGLARAWPLSSVGLPGLQDVDPDPFIDHPSLRRLYADRIIERADVSRLRDPRAAEAVREALGARGELAPESVRRALNDARSQ